MEPDESAKEGDRAPVHVGDDTNIKDGVDAVTNKIETTTLTTATVDYRTGLGFTSVDIADGLLKWFTGCAGAKSKLLPEDTEETRGGVIHRLKRRLSERTSRRSKPFGGKYERSRSHDDKNRAGQSIRQLSYELAMNEPQDNVTTTLNNTTTVSSGTHSVPASMNARISNNLGRNDDSLTAHSTGAQHGQTSIQSHQTTIYRKKDATIVNPDVYQFTFPERGYMVNIVNDRFTQQPSRDGAQWDLRNMEEIGRKFGFRLFNYKNGKNLTRNETLSLLRKIQLMDHSNCDCFMFMISTHGLEQPNRALRGKLDHALTCADDQLIFTSSILDMFSDRNCPTLRGKPKIFFVQACRGEQLDHGSDVFVVNTQPVDRTDQTVFSDQKPKRHNKQEYVDEYDTLPGQDSWTQPHGEEDVRYRPTDTGKSQDSWTQHHGEEDVRYRPTAIGNSNNKYTTTVTVTLAAGAPQSYGGQPQYYAPKELQFPTTVTATLAAGAPQSYGGQPQCYAPKESQFPTTVTATMAAGASQSYRGQAQFCAPKQSQFPTAASIRNQYTVTKVPFYPGTSATEWLRPYPIVDTPSLRCSNDMLVMYAIPQGMYAWRSQTVGSWMIHYLHQVLMSHNMKSQKSFLSLLTKVSRVMSQRSTYTPSLPEMHEKKAIPVIEHKLDKDIVFQPKVKGSEWVKTFKQMSL